MRLSRFISAHSEEILAEWESYARTFRPAGSQLSSLVLRNSAKLMLEAMALDIESEESPEQQSNKSRGMTPGIDAENSAASTHGTQRQHSGFSLIQVTAEFRALRATVLRLWLPQITQFTQATLNDMVRFNEAIDQALAESILTYSSQATHTRDTFLAILGHDLRGPLATMTMAGDYLTSPGVGTAYTLQLGGRVKRRAATMTKMVNDLLEYARSQLGGDMPLATQLADVREIYQRALDDASAAHPDCPFEMSASGELVNYFDSIRMQQVFTNLLNNAAQYRDKNHPVTILAQGEPEEIVVRVQNFGPVIPAKSLHSIFDPLVQLPVQEQQKGPPSTSMGLGLFIAREITEAHGGTITAESSESSGTVFTLRLPRTHAAL